MASLKAVARLRPSDGLTTTSRVLASFGSDLDQQDLELLTSTLRQVLGHKTAAAVSQRLLLEFRTLPKLLAQTSSELRTRSGIPEAAIDLLNSVRHCAFQLIKHEVFSKPVSQNWPRVEEYLIASMARLPTERVRVLFLDVRNYLLADEEMSVGTIGHAAVYPREIMRRALFCHASSLVIVHNHPSGDSKPSWDDIEMTKILVDLGRGLDITVHDHLIVTEEETFSFRRAEMI
jgi:DNA repair protein RadC